MRGPRPSPPWWFIAALALGEQRSLTAAAVTVTSQAELTANLLSGSNILLGGDLYLFTSGTVQSSPTGVIINNGQTDLVIDGQDLYKLDGQSTMRCIYINGVGVEVQLKNLIITNGYSAVQYEEQRSAKRASIGVPSLTPSFACPRERERPRRPLTPHSPSSACFCARTPYLHAPFAGRRRLCRPCRHQQGVSGPSPFPLRL